MTKIFKKNDLVKCVDNHGWEDSLTVGKIYKVLENMDTHPGQNSQYCKIECDKHFDGNWNSYRFKLVNTKIMCDVDVGEYLRQKYEDLCYSAYTTKNAEKELIAKILFDCFGVYIKENVQTKYTVTLEPKD